MSRMNDLVLYKSKNFQGSMCDLYRDINNDIFMTSEQLGVVLGYSNPQKGNGNGHGKIITPYRREILQQFRFLDSGHELKEDKPRAIPARIEKTSAVTPIVSDATIDITELLNRVFRKR